jgi:hypothetical protein
MGRSFVPKLVVGKEHWGRGRRVMLKIGQNDVVFYRGFLNFIFYFNKGILVILYPKTTSF